MAAGLVLGTDPEPGDRVLDGGTVTLVLSLGPERYEVPALAGMTEDQAQDALEQGNLSFGESTEKFSDTVPAGQVIRTDAQRRRRSSSPTRPSTWCSARAAGRSRSRTGPARTPTSATAALEKRKLVVEVTGEEYSDTVAEGDVISQDPTAGPLYKGDTVQLVVSRGPELVEVPEVVAMGVEAATEKLEVLGFRGRGGEQRQLHRASASCSAPTPSAGSMAPKGSTITLYLI